MIFFLLLNMTYLRISGILYMEGREIKTLSSFERVKEKKNHDNTMNLDIIKYVPPNLTLNLLCTSKYTMLEYSNIKLLSLTCIMSYEESADKLHELTRILLVYTKRF